MSLFRNVWNMSSLVLLLLLSAVCCAQTMPSIESLLSVTPLGDGRMKASIVNSSAIPITAYAITVITSTAESPTARGSATRFIRDTATNTIQKELPEAGETSFVVGVKGGGLPPTVKLQAVIFEDGSSIGDADWVSVLLQRRQSYHKTLLSLLNDLNRVKSQQLDHDAILKILMTTQDTLSKDADNLVKQDLTNSKSIAPTAIRDMYVETSREAKEANLKLLVDQEGRAWIRRLYGFAVKNIQSSEPAFTIDLLIKKLNQV